MTKNGNGKAIAAWVTIAVTVVSIFTIQAINADVRNCERDEKQDEKISMVQTDMREVRTRLEYLKDATVEQKVVNKEILQQLKEIKNQGEPS